MPTTTARAAVITGLAGYLADVEVGGRRVADLDVLGNPTDEARFHCHSLTDGLAGYIVRQTKRDGRVLSSGNPLDATGFPVAVVTDPRRYGAAVEIAREVRAVQGSYAVIDSVYVCGCRSGY